MPAETKDGKPAKKDRPSRRRAKGKATGDQTGCRPDREISRMQHELDLAGKRILSFVKISNAINSLFNLDDILSTVTAEIGGLVEFDRSSVAFVTPDGRRCFLRDIWKEKGEIIGEGREIPLDRENVIAWVIQNKKAILRSDIEEDPRFEEVVSEESLRSDMIAPLVVRDRCIGTLNLGSYRKDAFKSIDFQILENCAKLTSIAIENARLFEEVSTLEGKNRMLLESASDAIFTLDPDTGRFLMVNSRTESLFDSVAGEILGRRIFDLVSHEEAETIRMFLNDVARNQEAILRDFRVHEGEREERILDIHGNIVRHGGEKVVFNIAHDTTEHRRLRQSIERKNVLLSEQNEKLRKLDRVKTEFLASMSHELKTPLTAIIAFAEALRDESDPRTLSDFNKVILEEGRKLKGLIDNLLDLSKLETSEITLDRRRVDMREVVRSSVASMLPIAKKKLIAVEQGYPSRPVEIDLDEVRIRQVIWNLVSNAVKFTKKNGRVRISLQDLGAEVKVEVEDNGIGIREEYRESIFEKFTQIDPTGGGERKGLGLGLGIVKQLVELHGGSVEVHSTYGEGSRFAFTIPISSRQTKILDEGSLQETLN